MKRSTWLSILGLAVALLILWLVFRPGGGERVSADLIAQFPKATEKRPNPEVFSVVSATLTGQTKQAILVKDPSRLVYEVTVPEKGELRLSLGLQEEAWKIEGDGVLFRILIGANGNQEEVLNLNLNPFANPSDRGWHDLALDLSEYAGETVAVFLNTNASPPSRPQRDDHNGDFALWGAPRIVAR